MVKKLFLIITICILGFGVWYFMVKSYDYKVTFNTSLSQGVVYSSISAWSNWKNPKKQLVTTLYKKPFSEIEQEFKVSDSIINIHWEIERVSDSATKVSALLKDKDHSFLQKLKVPFTKTDFVKRSIQTVKKIKNDLKVHEASFKLSFVEKAIIPETHCACISTKSTLNKKALEMISHNSELLQYINLNNLKLDGKPLLKVTVWDFDTDMISFDFCFPVKKLDNYPKHAGIQIKTIESQPALKVTFNGNYKISDRAWFSLIDYAKQNHIEIEPLPTEFFFNNPHNGGNELEWKAEVYMPIIE